RRLAERMRDETGTEFFEWVDHVVVTPDQAEALRAAGFVEKMSEPPSGITVFWHPRAMMPRVLLHGVAQASSPALSTQAGGAATPTQADGVPYGLARQA